MSLIAKDNAKEFLPLSAGTHVARICGIIHIGTITDNIKGTDITRNRVFISFEVPSELQENGKPYTIGQEFTLSMNKQGNLLPFIESLLGKKLSKEECKEYDVFTLIGHAGMINVIHSAPTSEGVVYANIKSVSPLPKGTVCPDVIVEPYKFDYEENFNADWVWAMNEKTSIYKKITRSEEWLAKGLVKPSQEENMKGLAS